MYQPNKRGVEESCYVTSNLDVYQIVVESGTHSSGMRPPLTAVIHEGSQLEYASGRFFMNSPLSDIVL